MDYAIGFAVGVLAMWGLGVVDMYLYKRILVRKANDGTAEHILGKFYYIREEGK